MLEEQTTQACLFDREVSFEEIYHHYKYKIWIEPKDILLVLRPETMYVYCDTFVNGVALLHREKIIYVYSTGVIESVEPYFMKVT